MATSFKPSPKTTHNQSGDHIFSKQTVAARRADKSLGLRDSSLSGNLTNKHVQWNDQQKNTTSIHVNINTTFYTALEMQI